MAEHSTAIQQSNAPDGDERPSFQSMLQTHGKRLTRDQTHTLQINVGLRCNQTCRHCHLRAGPDSCRNMNRDTAEAVIAYARRAAFRIIDITGGAPEMNPHLGLLIERLAPHAQHLMLRSNLSALNSAARTGLFDALKTHRVAVVASLPSVNIDQTDSQRGPGIFDISIEVLRGLNAMGYGSPNSGLELNLVSNPSGAFLPPPQDRTENRYRQVLKKKWGIVFNNLYTFANVPLGRFRDWLLTSGNYDNYLAKLHSRFNPCAVDGLMCRSLVSVSWDGYLYDCDFNLAGGLPMGGRRVHVARLSRAPEAGSPIATAEHCFTCTAGSGFT